LKEKESKRKKEIERYRKRKRKEDRYRKKKKERKRKRQARHRKRKREQEGERERTRQRQKQIVFLAAFCALRCLPLGKKSPICFPPHLPVFSWVPLETSNARFCWFSKQKSAIRSRNKKSDFFPIRRYSRLERFSKKRKRFFIQKRSRQLAAL
jgi:hypothetical protein